ncbi:hypothetical protein LINPERHAP1_LOCUS19147, partial [Linum perenne]
VCRNSEGERNRSAGVKEKRKSQEDRYYSTRAAAGGVGGDENGKGEEKSGGGVERVVWPKLYISLSSKEKEEDFLAMKGCKLPQRPKKRAKIIQRTILASGVVSSFFILHSCYGQ